MLRPELILLTTSIKLCFLPVLLLIGSNLQAQYLEHFEFAAGSIAASTGLNGLWETAQWMGEDALVSDEQALSGTKSLKLESTDVLGGPQDVVLVFGGRYLGCDSISLSRGNSVI